ncbi:MAG: LysR family transcriptional regulator [Thermodesulfobacteriota bacterium]|nr:LysR family transcriptional regulator [Thermodesulfobacteriota bacterium]
MEIKYRIWVEEDDKVLFGKGRESLLEAIDECQSLNKAAKKLNMSYRAAWGRLKASEERLGIKLAENSPDHKGMILTDEARHILSKFEKLERETRSFIEKTARKLGLLSRMQTGKTND